MSLGPKVHDNPERNMNLYGLSKWVPLSLSQKQDIPTGFAKSQENFNPVPWGQ